MSADEASTAARLGESALLGAAAGALVAAPAAIRTANDGASIPVAWLALAGAASLVIGPAIVAARAARPFSRAHACVPLGAALAAGPIMVFATILKAATHHRPLGATVFAIVAVGVVLGAVALSARLLEWALRPEGDRARGPARVVLGVLLLGSLALSARQLLPALGHDAAAHGIRAGLLDALLALIAVVVATRVQLPKALERGARVAGLPILAALIIVGIVLLRSSPELLVAARAPASMVLAAAGWLSG